MEQACQSVFGTISLDARLASKTVASPMEEEVRQAKQALKLQLYTLEAIAHLSDENTEDQQSALLAQTMSIQVSKEAEIDHEWAIKE